MNTDELIAIDVHTHAEVSCWNPFDNYGDEYDRAADKYFGSDRRPSSEQTIAHYREKKIGLVMFTVDSESQLGRRRIPNEEICEAAAKNSDMMVAFASIDPHKGKMGAREARRAMTAGAASITEDQVRALLGQLLDAVAKAAEDSELRGQARMALREVLDRVEIDAAQNPPVLSLHCAVQTGDMVASPRGFEPL